MMETLSCQLISDISSKNVLPSLHLAQLILLQFQLQNSFSPTGLRESNNFSIWVHFLSGCGVSLFILFLNTQMASKKRSLILQLTGPFLCTRRCSGCSMLFPVTAVRKWGLHLVSEPGDGCVTVEYSNATTFKVKTSIHK